MKPKIRIVPLSKLVLDDANANQGTKRGRELLSRSLAKYGTGRSVLVDKNNRVIAGNKTVEQARAAGTTASLSLTSSGILASLDADLKEFWNESELTKVLGEFGPAPL